MENSINNNRIGSQAQERETIIPDSSFPPTTETAITSPSVPSLSNHSTSNSRLQQSHERSSSTATQQKPLVSIGQYNSSHHIAQHVYVTQERDLTDSSESSSSSELTRTKTIVESNNSVSNQKLQNHESTEGDSNDVRGFWTNRLKSSLYLNNNNLRHCQKDSLGTHLSSSVPTTGSSSQGTNSSGNSPSGVFTGEPNHQKSSVPVNASSIKVPFRSATKPPAPLPPPLQFPDPVPRTVHNPLHNLRNEQEGSDTDDDQENLSFDSSLRHHHDCKNTSENEDDYDGGPSLQMIDTYPAGSVRSPSAQDPELDAALNIALQNSESSKATPKQRLDHNPFYSSLSNVSSNNRLLAVSRTFSSPASPQAPKPPLPPKPNALSIHQTYPSNLAHHDIGNDSGDLKHDSISVPKSRSTYFEATMIKQENSKRSSSNSSHSSTEDQTIYDENPVRESTNTFNANIISTPTLPISAPPTSTATLNDLRTPSSKKRQDLAKAISEARKKLERLGCRPVEYQLSNSKSVMNLKISHGGVPALTGSGSTLNVNYSAENGGQHGLNMKRCMSLSDISKGISSNYIGNPVPKDLCSVNSNLLESVNKTPSGWDNRGNNKSRLSSGLGLSGPNSMASNLHVGRKSSNESSNLNMSRTPPTANHHTYRNQQQYRTPFVNNNITRQQLNYQSAPLSQNPYHPPNQLSSRSQLYQSPFHINMTNNSNHPAGTNYNQPPPMSGQRGAYSGGTAWDINMSNNGRSSAPPINFGPPPTSHLSSLANGVNAALIDRCQPGGIPHKAGPRSIISLPGGPTLVGRGSRGRRAMSTGARSVRDYSDSDDEDDDTQEDEDEDSNFGALNDSSLMTHLRPVTPPKPSAMRSMIGRHHSRGPTRSTRSEYNLCSIGRSPSVDIHSSRIADGRFQTDSALKYGKHALHSSLNRPVASMSTQQRQQWASTSQLSNGPSGSSYSQSTPTMHADRLDLAMMTRANVPLTYELCKYVVDELTLLSTYASRLHQRASFSGNPILRDLLQSGIEQARRTLVPGPDPASGPPVQGFSDSPSTSNRQQQSNMSTNHLNPNNHSPRSVMTSPADNFSDQLEEMIDLSGLDASLNYH